MKKCSNKSCKSAGRMLPLTDFHRQPNGPLGFMSQCKICCRARVSAYRKTPEGNRKRRDTILKNKYGIGLDEYEDKLKKQDNKCSICESVNAGGSGVFHVDHDHQTGVVRGLLCVHCNYFIGWLENKNMNAEDLLQKAVSYLKAWGSKCLGR